MQIKIIRRIKHAIITVYYLVHNDSFNAYTGKKKVLILSLQYFLLRQVFK